MKRYVIRLSILCLLALGIFAFTAPDLLARAATVSKVTAYCSRATVSGKIEQPARFVQISVTPASNLSQSIARVYARVWPGRSYSKSFSYAAQQPGTRLIFAVCESDGSTCLRPATMVGVDCQPEGATATPIPIGTPTWTPLPETLTPTPTEVPLTPSPTPIPTTPSPSPTGLPVTPTMESSPIVFSPQVSCSSTVVVGQVGIPAPYVRLTLSQSNPIQQIASVVVPVEPDGSFQATASYPQQPEGALLLGAIGEWDGTWWLRPAATFGAYCQSDEFPPTPTPTPIAPSSLGVRSLQFWPETSVVDRYGTFDFGARVDFESTILTRAYLLAFLTYQGQAIPSQSTCMSRQMPQQSQQLFWSIGMPTEFMPGPNTFEQSYRYDHSAPGDATHLVMWMIFLDANDQALACWQQVIGLSPVSQE